MTARNVVYLGVDGSRWHLHGDQMGAEGVYLSSLNGLYHPQVTSLSSTPAFRRGAIPAGSKTDVSKIGLKIFTTADTVEEWEEVESRWWRAWSPDEDGRIIVQAAATGRTRWQPIRLESWPSEPFDWEPEDVMDWTIPAISYSPGWRGPLIRSSFVGPGVGTIPLANPGDIDAWPQYTGDPVAGIKLPDGIAGDLVALPNDMDPENGEWFVETDQEQGVTAEDREDSQLVALMAGMLFRHPIPRWQKRVLVPIEAGATTIRAYLQPLYHRPWG